MMQGLILILAINRPRSSKSRSNRIFTFFLILILTTLFGNSFFVRQTLADYPHMGLLMDDMYFLYGPLLYLYVGALLGFEVLFQKRIWLHFVLPAVHITTMMEYVLMSPGEFYLAMGAGVWQYPYDQALAILSIGLYVTLSWRVYLMSDQKGQYTFLRIIFWVLAIGLILWVNQFAVNVFRFDLGARVSRYTNPWTLFPLITILLGFFAIQKTSLFDNKFKPKPYSGSSLSTADIEAIRVRLEAYMTMGKPYLDPRVSLDQVATELSIKKKDLSRVINQEFGFNFFDFVNSYRILEFKRIATPEALRKHKILGLAFDAGFNSKSAFNKIFKRLEGVTPSEYLKEQSK